MLTTQLTEYVSAGKADEKLISLYGAENLSAQKARYINAVKAFEAGFGVKDVSVFSAPGRSELSGNHTDHNHGCVVACSVDIDIIAVAAKTDGNSVNAICDGFGRFSVDLAKFKEPDRKMAGTSESLVAGMCAYLTASGYAVGGFDAYITSAVPGGSGLSSSAAFEDLIGCIESHLYNEGRVSPVEIAKLSQKAENNYFFKPCGLMDQVACAVGGIVAIDFADPSKPIIKPVDFDLSAKGYKLCITNTGGSHADLTDDYASVPAEMKAVAAYLGCEVLRDADEAVFTAKIPELREKFGDRAVLRALHFFAENKRVRRQTDSLLSDDLPAFLDDVKASGRSSFCYLQNVYTTKDVKNQGVSLALCLSEKLLDGADGAWRVHGGGFAGTIQAFVPDGLVDAYRNLLDSVFGVGACHVLRVRGTGITKAI